MTVEGTPPDATETPHAAADRIALLESEIDERRAEIARLRLVVAENSRPCSDEVEEEGPTEGRDDDDKSGCLHRYLREMIEPPEWLRDERGGDGRDADCYAPRVSNDGDAQPAEVYATVPESNHYTGRKSKPPPADIFDILLHPPPRRQNSMIESTSQVTKRMIDKSDRKIHSLQATIHSNERVMKMMIDTMESLKGNVAELKRRNSNKKTVIRGLTAHMVRLHCTKLTAELELNHQLESRDEAMAMLQRSCLKKVRRFRRLSADLASTNGELEDEVEMLRAENVKLQHRAKVLEDEWRVAEEKMEAMRAYSRSFRTETPRFGILL